MRSGSYLIDGFSGNLPTIFASLRCLKTGRIHKTRFLIDTGSCETVLPAQRAKEWGFDNQNPEVPPFSMAGLGSAWNGYYHPAKFGLLADLLKGPVWEASQNQIAFVENLGINFGLIGMDVIRQWKEFRIEPSPTGGRILIAAGSFSEAS